jgi:HlyD family secretion protein
MSDVLMYLPVRRSDLVIRPIGDDGRYVVKDPRSGDYFQIGGQEHFLLQQLDSRCEAGEIRTARQTIVARVSGIVMTPHVVDRIGHYLPQGSPICEVADADCLIAEIALTEDGVRRVEVQQAVHLRPRGLTSEMPATQVLRIAPAAVFASEEQAGNLPGTVTVACEVDSVDGRLRPGMTGRARIDTGRRTIAAIACDRVKHYLRTEFWW